MVVIVVQYVVVVDSQEVVILELRPFEVGLRQFQADFDKQTTRRLRRQNLQRLAD